MVQATFTDNFSGEMEMKNVHKSFGSKKVLDGVTFTIKNGSFTCLCGPSGCGKTTIMNILAGYLMSDKGECLFNGAPVKGPNIDRLPVFQETTLFPWLTLWDNTLFGPKMQGKDLRQATEQARELISLSGLSGFENKYPRQLSGGMQRRAELIRVLINEPKILLMDEPFRGLDAMTRAIMEEHFIKVFETTGITMLLITSELEEAIFMGDTVYFLSTIPTKIKKEIWYLSFIQNPRALDAVYTSLVIAGIASFFTTAFGILVAYGITQFEVKRKEAIIGLTYLPMIVSPLIIGISLLLFFHLIHLPLGYVSVIITHVVRAFPFVTLIMFTSFLGVRRSLIEAALDLGASKFSAFRRVIFPTILPGIIASSLMAFTISFDEISSTYFVIGGGLATIQTYIFEQIEFVITPEMNALTSSILMLSSILITITWWIQKRMQG